MEHITVSDKEFFLSDRWRKFVEAHVKAVIPRLPIDVRIQYDPNNPGTVGSTNSTTIWINAASVIVQAYELQSRRALAFMGVLNHELAHILYLDFKGEQAYFEGIANGDWPSAPVDAEDDDLDEMEQFMQSDAGRRLIYAFYHETSNIVADSHDEYKMSCDYGTDVANSITCAADALQNSEDPFEDRVASGKSTPLSLMYNLMLQYVRFNEVILKDDTYTDEYIEALDEVIPALEDCLGTDNTTEKFAALTTCLCFLWKYVKKTLQDQQSGGGSSNSSNASGNSSGSDSDSSGASGDGSDEEENSGGSTSGSSDESDSDGSNSSSSGGMPSEEEIEELVNQIMQAAGNCQLTETAANPVSAKGSSKPLAGNPVVVAANAISAELQDEKAEKAAADDLCVKIQTMDMNSTHKGRKVTPIRNLAVTSDDIREYNNLMTPDMRRYVRAIKAQMLNALQDIMEGDTRKNLLSGKTFVGSEAHRLDRKSFANRKDPQDFPDMAISILVDQSGSMTGGRIDAAKQATLLVHACAEALGIPIMICGHTTSPGGIYFFVHTDFDQITDKDKYRITHLDARYCNRDGMAIEVAARLLAERPESNKLLFVISDGQPNDDGYGGQAAKDDIRSIVRSYRNKGIVTFACAIAHDKEVIRDIYGQGYLDISDLSRFPKTLCRMILQNLDC